MGQPSEIRAGHPPVPPGKRVGSTWRELKPCDTAIKYINHLFETENKLEVLSPEGRKEQRLIQEKPVLDAFWSWVEESAPIVLPSSKLGKAFISNNLAENSIRPFTIGRKNWLFSSSPKGAEASAGYTL